VEAVNYSFKINISSNLLEKLLKSFEVYQVVNVVEKGLGMKRYRLHPIRKRKRHQQANNKLQGKLWDAQDIGIETNQ
jgi:hypothetical protein